jgi:hypothetical protein
MSLGAQVYLWDLSVFGDFIGFPGLYANSLTLPSLPKSLSMSLSLDIARSWHGFSSCALLCDSMSAISVAKCWELLMPKSTCYEETMIYLACCFGRNKLLGTCS